MYHIAHLFTFILYYIVYGMLHTTYHTTYHYIIARPASAGGGATGIVVLFECSVW